MKIKFSSRSLADTKWLASAFAPLLKKGDVVLLIAGLGSGKTTFVQGAAQALKADQKALSPTFILVQTLRARVPLHHMDFYRLKKNEILNYGLQDYLTGRGEIPTGIVFIEWADRCPEIWPEERCEIHIKIKKNNEREFLFIPKGKRNLDLIKKLKIKLAKHEKTVFKS